MQRLKRIRLKGWKSVADQTIDLEPLTVLIGANGAGKSSLLSVFKLINAMFGKTPGLRKFIAMAGGADSVLHFGAKNTPIAEMELTFQTKTGDTTYFARWAAAAGGTLIFTDERIEFLREDTSHPTTLDLGVGHTESNLIDRAGDGDMTAKTTLHLLRGCRLFHFHDTSDTSPVRTSCRVDANRFLQPDAGNLAAMLFLYREKHPATYKRIVATIEQMVPDFSDFVLEPDELNEKQINLQWSQSGHDYDFGAHQLSDGTIRFMALACLLLQPNDKMPLLITLDEPELGLHPAALEILADMVKTASVSSQLVLATQSSLFLDHFESEDVLTVSCASGVTTFQHHTEDELAHWLESYTLGEVWEKNIIGGGPYG